MRLFLVCCFLVLWGCSPSPAQLRQDIEACEAQGFGYRVLRDGLYVQHIECVIPESKTEPT